MKFRLLSLFLLCSTIVFAQYERRDTRTSVYFTAGINQAGAVGWEDPDLAGAGYFTGFNGGMGFAAVLDKRNTLVLGLEAAFSSQGFRNTEVSADTDLEKIIVNYINVPVVIRKYPFRKFSSMYFGLGPQVSFQVGGHIKTKGGESVDIVEGSLTKTVFSGVGVVGFNFGRTLNFGLELGYHRSFSKFIEIAPELRHSVFFGKLFLPVDFIADVMEGLQ